MALDYQVAPITFTKGLDTHSQRKLVVPGKWDTLVNVSLSEDGSVRRRDGFEALVDGQAGNWLATHNDELLIANGSEVSTVAAGLGSPKTVARANGHLPYVDVSRSEVAHDGANRDFQDMAASSTHACYVWRGYAAGAAVVTGIYCTLVDLATGAKLIDNELVDNFDSHVRVVSADGFFYIVTLRAGVISCATIDGNAPSTLGSLTVVALDGNIPAKAFDACDFGSEVIIVYAYNDGVTSVRAAAITGGGTPTISAGPLNLVTEAAVTNASIQALAVRGYDSPTLIGAYLLHSAGGALAAGLVGAVISDTAFTVATAATALSPTPAPAVASACHVTATPVGSNMHVFADNQSSYGTAAIRPLFAASYSPTLVAVAAGGAMMNSACFTVNGAQASGPQGPFIAGKAFTSGGTSFLPVCMMENYFSLSLGTNTKTLNEQNAFFLLRVDTIGSPFVASVVGGALYQTLGMFDATLGGTTSGSTGAPTICTPGSTPAISSGFGICLQERGDLQLTNGFNTTPVGLSHLTLTPRTTSPGTDAQLAECAYFSGGQLGAYDGRQIVQNGFPMFPEGCSAVVSAPGGGTKLTVGVHQVVFVYEWYDGAGNRHQSAPSLPISVTVANVTDQINCLVPTTQIAQSAGWDPSISTLRIVGYMTTAGGLQFYRAITSYTPVTNSVAATTVAYVIGAVVMTDDRLATNELLYTQPNQAGTTLPNMPAGPMHGVGVSQGRLWGFASDSNRYVYSQEPLPNVGLQFNNDALGGPLPSESGDGVMVAELDEKTILLCGRKLYVVYGNGPTPSGGFNNFSDPQEIPSDVGCSDARSVLSMPRGLMFKSEKGWYLLGRDLSVRYVGEGVARWDEYDVSSAVMMGDRQECRFSSGNAACPTLVYSYEVDAWSVFYMGNLIHPGTVTDAVWWPATGRYVHLQPSDAIFPGLMQDTPGEYIDGLGTSDPLQALIYARTSWLRVAALEGFQRIRRMYLTATGADDTLPDTNLVIAVDFDDLYEADAPGAYTVTVPLGPVGVSADDPESIDLRHRLARQKCKSVAFSFLEGGGVDPSANPLDGLQVSSLEVGVKRNVNRLPAAQTIG